MISTGLRRLGGFLLVSGLRVGTGAQAAISAMVAGDGKVGADAGNGGFGYAFRLRLRHSGEFVEGVLGESAFPNTA